MGEWRAWWSSNQRIGGSIPGPTNLHVDVSLNTCMVAPDITTIREEVKSVMLVNDDSNSNLTEVIE